MTMERHEPEAFAAVAGWAFQPLVDPPLPEVRDRDWPHSSVDHFTLAQLEATNLSPTNHAEKRTLALLAPVGDR